MTEMPAPLPRRFVPALALAYTALALLAYWPTLDGGFVSDDALVVAFNPYIQALSADNLAAILDPYGPAVIYSLNYAPVHMALHAVERFAFGEHMLGYHLVNVALHVVSTLLLVLLLVASRLPVTLAAAAGAVFLVHPANAEAVAMIFQAKTLLSTALAFGAIWAFWRWPAAATALFAAALLTKIAAAFALPMLAVLVWARSSDEPGEVPHLGWLIGWVVVLLLVAIPEYAVFERIGQHAVALGEGGAQRTLNIVAIAGRYLVMAATGYGVSALHSPDAVETWADPWWLLGIVGLALLAWRSVVTLMRREEEAAWWIAAAAAFAPISQVFPFQYPMADRYLYMVLPGLLGGGLLAVGSGAPADRIREWLGPDLVRKLRLAPVASLVAIALLFAVSTRLRSPVFRSDGALLDESAQNYPNGINAWVVEFADGVNSNDAPRVRRALRELHGRGYSAFQAFERNLSGRPLAEDPEIRAILAEMAGYYVGHYESIARPHQVELRMLAEAYLATGRSAEAQATAERALELGGPHDEEAREVLRRARLASYREKRAAGSE